MTIEGRPEIQHDWDKEYAQQRRSRMVDAIEDFLQDEKVDSRQTYEEMLQCIQELIDFHKKNLKKVEGLRDLMLGYRNIDLDLDFPERY